MREIIPRIAACTVILAHGAPRPLTEIRSPEVPTLSGRVILCNAALLGIHDSRRRHQKISEMFISSENCAPFNPFIPNWQTYILKKWSPTRCTSSDFDPLSFFSRGRGNKNEATPVTLNKCKDV